MANIYIYITSIQMCFDLLVGLLELLGLMAGLNDKNHQLCREKNIILGSKIHVNIQYQPG